MKRETNCCLFSKTVQMIFSAVELMLMLLFIEWIIIVAMGPLEYLYDSKKL